MRIHTKFVAYNIKDTFIALSLHATKERKGGLFPITEYGTQLTTDIGDKKVILAEFDETESKLSKRIYYRLKEIVDEAVTNGYLSIEFDLDKLSTLHVG